jgi:hypothetical protein
MDNRSLETVSQPLCHIDNKSLSHQQLIDHFVVSYPIDMWKKEGFFTDSDLWDINCYWLQFEPVRMSVHCLLAVLYIFIFFVGCSANATVLYVFYRSVCPLFRLNCRKLQHLYTTVVRT